MMTGRENAKELEDNIASVTFRPPWISCEVTPGLNPKPRGNNPASDPLSYATAVFHKLQNFVTLLLMQEKSMHVVCCNGVWWRLYTAGISNPIPRPCRLSLWLAIINTSWQRGLCPAPAALSSSNLSSFTPKSNIYSLTISPGHSQHNAQWVWSSPLTQISLVGWVWVTTGQYLRFG
jgi:hypothetical protein